MNFTDAGKPYTRIVGHKHFEFGKGHAGRTIITCKYGAEWKPGDEPYYPVNDEKNQLIYAKYKELAAKEQNILFCGRLAEYKYYDMDQVIRAALSIAQKKRDNRRIVPNGSTKHRFTQ